MKIAIVGAGNAGCITALHYRRYLDGVFTKTENGFQRGECEISIYHSPDKHPIERVGQGTISPIVELISKVLDIV